MASVRWSNRSLEDLRDIRTFIADSASELISERVANSITEATRRLTLFPHMGRVVPEYDDADFREIIAGNYRVTYLVQDLDSVFIVTVIHGRRDLVTTVGPDPRRII